MYELNLSKRVWLFLLQKKREWRHPWHFELIMRGIYRAYRKLVLVKGSFYELEKI